MTPRDPVSVVEDTFLAFPEDESMSIIATGPDFPFSFQ